MLSPGGGLLAMARILTQRRQGPQHGSSFVIHRRSRTRLSMRLGGQTDHLSTPAPMDRMDRQEKETHRSTASVVPHAPLATAAGDPRLGTTAYDHDRYVQWSRLSAGRSRNRTCRCVALLAPAGELRVVA
jgi:hypothetical protein